MEESHQEGTVELTTEGYAAINAHIEKLENFVNAGILEPEKAAEHCREIRSELYCLLQTLRTVCVISPGAAEPAGITF